jgi:hypothetical protein
MKNFDARWQACAARARQATPRDEEAPFGFAARVVARGLRPQSPAPDSAWERLAMRLLAGAVGLLVICAVLEMPHLRNTQPLEPGVENTVAQLVWSL